MKLLLVFLALLAGNLRDESLRAVLALTGAGTPEELSQTELERFETLSQHPVRINLSTRSRLLSCGLFSTYQVASMCAYIEDNGHILSVAELGSVNGFDDVLARHLSHFISFESHSPPGSPPEKRTRQDAMLRLACKDESHTMAAKYHISCGERAEAFLSAKDGYTMSVAVYGRRPWSLIAGDFNARLGQGLLLWSGMSMSGVPSPSALFKSANGFSASGSFSPGFRGAAAGWMPGNWVASVAITTKGTLMGSVQYTGRNGKLGLNALSESSFYGLSADWQLGLGHLTWYGEGALGGRSDACVPAIVSGLSWAPAYKSKFAILGRFYPAGYTGKHAAAVRTASKTEDEAGISAGAQYRWLNLTLDSAVHPQKLKERKKNSRSIKSILDASPQWNWGGAVLNPEVRWVQRVQLSPVKNRLVPDCRQDMRMDMTMQLKAFSAKLRYNIVKSGDTGWLSYAETGYRTPSDSSRLHVYAYLRACFYDTPGWETRIYCYERDVPGAFSVPACYGRGFSCSLTGGIKYRKSWNRQHAIYIRASLSKALHDGRTVVRNEVKLQYQLRL